MLKTVRILAAALPALLIAQLAHALNLSQRVDFNIPAQTLSAALIEFSHQSRIQVIISDDISGQTTQGITGLYAISDALRRLLSSSGLDYRVVSDSSIVIARRKPARAAASTAIGKADLQTQATIPKSAPPPPSAPLAGTATADATVANSEGNLIEIVVTAQRRQQSIQSVPISMTAFSQSTLDELGIHSFSDLAAVVPGLVISTPAASTQSWTNIAIRGIYSNDNSPTTAVYIDDTPVMIRQDFQAGYSGSPQPDVFDLERVEVLRGPQGTLFGASAMGGAIRYITHSPDMESSSGYVRGEAGFTDGGAPSYSVGGAFGAPIIPEHLGFRASASYRSSGGFVDMENPYSGAIDHNADSAYTLVLQGALTWAPVTGLEITPTVFIQHHHSDNSDQYWLDRGLLPNPEPAKFVIGADILSPVRDDFGVYGLAVKYALPSMSLESNTSYLDRSYRDIDDWSDVLPLFVGAPAGPFPGLPAVHPYDQNVFPTRQWVQELRLTSQLPDSRWSWILGAYFQRTSQQTGQDISSLSPFTEAAFGESADQFFGTPEFVMNGQSFSSHTKFATVEEDEALFGSIAWSLTQRLKLDAGVRFEQTSIIDQEEIFAGPIAGTAYGVAHPDDERQTPVTPRVSLTYQYSANAMVYANAAKGFRPGGSNSPDTTQNPLCQKAVAALGLQSVPDNFDSDSLWSYELGTKDSLFDQRLVLDASAFYVDWTGIQTDIALNGCGQTFTANRGKAISQGFDLQIAAIPFSGLKLMGAVGYTHAYYPRAAYGAPVDGVATVQNVGGEQLANVIPWTAALNAEYSWSIDRLLAGTRSYIRADYRYLDRAPSINGADTNYLAAEGPNVSDAYEFLNMRVGITRSGLDVSVFADNITHANPHLNIYDLSGLFTASAIRPLTVGITAAYRF